MVIWIIGLSGSGKTTLAEEIVKIRRSRNKKIVLIDGDQIREMYGNDLGHSIEDRYKNADRICRICKFLDTQNIDVVCSILSLFKESREWCRDNLKIYFEVFIDTDIEILKSRDPKGIYKKFRNKEINNVAGLDLHFPIPDSADLKITNNSSKSQLLKYALDLANKF